MGTELRYALCADAGFSQRRRTSIRRNRAAFVTNFCECEIAKSALCQRGDCSAGQCVSCPAADEGDYLI